jgi:hypothetical protein
MMAKASNAEPAATSRGRNSHNKASGCIRLL